jgi:hypothetical protein
MTGDAAGAITAERDRLRLALAEVKRQCKSLRQQLRREQAEHLATHKRLEALRALLPYRDGGV